ncbi:MAG: hypothetical protein NSGCLCUN01_03512 [uncultured Clostridium sp.]
MEKTRNKKEKEIDKAEIERIYKSVLEEFNLKEVNGIQVVGDNVEKFKENFIRIVENNIL